ncbi:MAG: hypothetical protein FJX68_14985 [Alphaproteobacteria bacterium]|nr:hypothetical protein [Alphaproteobacteria bacterium]
MRIVVLVSQGQRNRGYGVPAEVMAAGVEAPVVETHLPVFPANRLEHKLIELSTIEGGLAAAAGADGIFINTVGDYGLAGLRSALRIPVVGAGQAGMHLAASLGERFAIVTIWPRVLRYLYQGLLRDYALSERCVAIRHVGEERELAALDQPDNFVLDMRAGKEAMVARIVKEMRAAIEQDGADTILLGCTCMAPIARRLAKAVEVPVVDPLTAGYKSCEMQAALGLVHSPLVFRPAANTPQRTRQLAAMIDAARPLQGSIAEACEMCQVTEAAE